MRLNNHWYADDDKLVYTGMDFVAFVVPVANEGLIEYHYYFSEGNGGRDAPIKVGENLKYAVGQVEMFFELPIDKQRQKFEEMLI